MISLKEQATKACSTAKLLSYELVRIPLALREYGNQLYHEARTSRESRNPSVMDLRDSLYAGVIKLGKMELGLKAYTEQLERKTRRTLGLSY